MDLSFVKQQLETKTKSGQKEKIDYSKLLWKPKPGKYTIRILPNQFRPEWPLREVSVYYGLAKWSILSLTNWGEQDPIVEFVRNLRKSKDKEDWMLANKLSPKIRYYMPVFVREEPEAGVRLWEVGKMINDTLLGIAADEDYGDFTDTLEGRDFTVEAFKDVVANKEVIKCNLRVKPKTSPISSDSELIKKLLNEQPDVLSFNRKYSYESLNELLQKYLSPANESETETESETEEEITSPNNEENIDDLPWDANGNDIKGKVSPANAFDKLFTK